MHACGCCHAVQKSCICPSNACQTSSRDSCTWPAQVVYGFWRLKVQWAEKQGTLPPDFWQSHWLWRGREARLLVEPLDIANWSALRPSYLSTLCLANMSCMTSQEDGSVCT